MPIVTDRGCVCGGSIPASACSQAGQARCGANAMLQAEVHQQYEQEFEAFQKGKYKESAENWLQSSWQGDALQVSLPPSLPSLLLSPA